MGSRMGSGPFRNSVTALSPLCLGQGSEWCGDITGGEGVSPTF
ncbi:MAG: hypothetical protein ACI9N0_001466 [Ilumatobacter sp.]|jgi:hypothetical protein